MKHFFLFGFVVLSFFAKAQFKQGDKVLNLVLSFNNQNGYDKQTTPNSLSYDRIFLLVSPKFGYLIKENIAIGGLLEGSITTFKFANNENTDKYFSGAAGFFVQRYFTVSENFLFSIEGQTKFTRGHESISFFSPVIGNYDTNKLDYYSLSISAFPTLTYLPKPNWGIQASIGSISHTLTKSLSVNDTANQTQLSFGNFSFGVSYFFRN
ncbi:MAG: hypothetical protein MUF68_04895 [Cyclobacteriaceae bacterium]|jgi:hypothetical protein|nr:hypothetical protein [Cyclobacteriaceae bacterium]